MVEISSNWHQDDRFWETWAPVLFQEERVAQAREHVDRLVPLLNITPEAKVLDLGCGIGRHSLEMARRGFQVTGVDRTTAYLERARKQAVEESLDIEFVREDMRTFCRPETFNAVINMFTTFGYFEDEEDDIRVLSNIYTSLKSGGSLIIDTHGKATLARIFQERIWGDRDGVIVMQHQQVLKNWSWMQSHWIMIKGNERTENVVSHRIYSATEMEKQLTGCGFSRVDIYGSLDGTPYDHTAQRLIAVGHK